MTGRPIICATCKFWSALVAQDLGNGRGVEALCLNTTGSKKQTFTTVTETCECHEVGKPLDSTIPDEEYYGHGRKGAR